MNDLGGRQGLMETLSLLVLVATLAPWVWIVRRLITRRPILPYEPRRPVPWGGLDVLLVALMWFFVFVPAVYSVEKNLLGRWVSSHFAAVNPVDLARSWLPAVRADPSPWLLSACLPSAAVIAPMTGELLLQGAFPGWFPPQHPMLVVVRANPSVSTFVICSLVAVAVAPIAEEFLFRLLLQGWLEAVERRLRRRIRVLRRLLPGMFAVAVSTLLFAVVHYRSAEVPNPSRSFHMLVTSGVAWSLAVGFGLLLLRARARASWADLGFVPARFWGDVRIGLVAALAIVGPMELLQLLVQTYLMPGGVAGDPVTLLLFAAVLGTLYARTHRIVPAITLHMGLNLSSMALAWLSAGM